MSRQTMQSRKPLERRKLAVDNADEITLDQDFNCPTTSDSHVEVTVDSRSPVGGHIDLFGKVIPSIESSSKSCLTKSKSKCVKRTPTSKKKKHLFKEQVTNSSIRKPLKRFTSTPRMVNIMKEAQGELNSIMGINQCPMDTSIETNYGLNISGVKSLVDGSTSSEVKKPESNSTINEDYIKSPVFEGKLQTLFGVT